jgi:MerR family transcriptional regulator, thiopeptide resistance regulator
MQNRRHPDTAETGWRVGRLAAATGVTVRTLHHYEEVGVLVPSERTEAGHRVYGDADVRRLYRVMALRQLGMSLSEIRETLDDGADLGAVLRAHLAHVERSIDRQRALRDRLATLCAQAAEGVSALDLVATIEGMAMHERYFTDEQRATLARRREELGEEAIRGVEDEWRDLAAALRAHMAAGDDPAAEPVRPLAQRARELVRGFTGGDPAMYASLERMYENEDAATASRGVMDADVMLYLRRAMEALPRSA